MIKNYFRILKKPHAYLQTILNTSVKFQKDRTETVGGVKGTKYLLKTRNHAPRATPHGKPKTVSLHFSSKRRGDNKQIIANCFLFIYNFLVYLSHPHLSIMLKASSWKKHTLLSCFVGYLWRIDIMNASNNLPMLKYCKVHDEVFIGADLNGLLGFV